MEVFETADVMENFIESIDELVYIYTEDEYYKQIELDKLNNEEREIYILRQRYIENVGFRPLIMEPTVIKNN
jgi:hypothetical protein